MHYGKSFSRILTTYKEDGWRGWTIMDGVIELPHLAHSHASREHIGSATMPKLWATALNAQQGIIVPGLTFQWGLGLQFRALTAPTGVRKEQMTDHNVSPSLFRHAAG